MKKYRFEDLRRRRHNRCFSGKALTSFPPFAVRPSTDDNVQTSVRIISRFHNEIYRIRTSANSIRVKTEHRVGDCEHVYGSNILYARTGGKRDQNKYHIMVSRHRAPFRNYSRIVIYNNYTLRASSNIQIQRVRLTFD